MARKNKEVKRLTNYANHIENAHPERAQQVRKNIARHNPHSNSRIIKELRSQFTPEQLAKQPKKKQIHKPAVILEQKLPEPVATEPLPQIKAPEIKVENINHAQEEKQEKQDKPELSQAVIMALGEAYLALITGITNYDLGHHFLSLGEFFLSLTCKTNNQLKVNVAFGFYEAIGKALINSKSKQTQNMKTHYGLLDANPDPATVGIKFTLTTARCDDLYIAQTIATVAARTLDRFIDYFKKAKANEPIFVDTIAGETPEMKQVRMMMELLNKKNGNSYPMFSKSYLLNAGPAFTADQLKQFNEYHKTIPKPANLPAKVITQLEARNYDAAVRSIVQDENVEQLKSLSKYLLEALTKFDQLDNKITYGDEKEQKHARTNSK